MNAVPPRELRTQRLLLRAPSVAQAAAVCDYQRRNSAHLAPWDPPYPPDFLELEATALRLAQGEAAFAAGTTWRYWFSLKEDPERIVGQAQLSQPSRGPFQNVILGYSLDQAAQGQGLMREALGALLDLAFGPVLDLHRIQAAVRPDNHRSRAVLQALGFVQEGLSRRYLFIDGAWRDHEVWALLNPHWPDGRAPRC